MRHSSSIIEQNADMLISTIQIVNINESLLKYYFAFSYESEWGLYWPFVDIRKWIIDIKISFLDINKSDGIIDINN